MLRHAMFSLTAAILFAASGASAQYRMDPPATGPAVAVDAPHILEKKDAMVPQELSFTNSDGKKVKLSDLFNQKKPVIIQMVYFSCPNLCGFSQDELIKTIRGGVR